MTYTYPTKQVALNAAIDSVRVDRPGRTTIWKQVATWMNNGPHIGAYVTVYDTDFRSEQSAIENYVVTQVDCGHMGDLTICAPDDGLDGTVTAKKNTPQETKIFTWRDENEYIRRKKAKKAKAFSERQREREGVGPTAPTTLFSKMLRSAAKTLAARLNGLKGSRPRKAVPRPNPKPVRRKKPDSDKATSRDLTPINADVLRPFEDPEKWFTVLFVN